MTSRTFMVKYCGHHRPVVGDPDVNNAFYLWILLKGEKKHYMDTNYDNRSVQMKPETRETV